MGIVVVDVEVGIPLLQRRYPLDRARHPRYIEKMLSVRNQTWLYSPATSSDPASQRFQIDVRDGLDCDTVALEVGCCQMDRVMGLGVDQGKVLGPIRIGSAERWARVVVWTTAAAAPVISLS